MSKALRFPAGPSSCVLLIVAMSASTLTLLLTGSRPAAPEAGGRAARARGGDSLHRPARVLPAKVDAEALETAAIDGMLAALGDPYTFYYTDEAYAAMNEETHRPVRGRGHAGGRGGGRRSARAARVPRFPGGKGRHRGGRTRCSPSTARARGRGRAHGPFRGLGAAQGRGRNASGGRSERGGEVLSFTLERSEVSINYVEYSILEGNVGYLSIYQFTGDDVEGVKEAISAFQQADVNALVVGRALQPRRTAYGRGGHLRHAAARGPDRLHRGSRRRARGVLRRRRILGCAHGRAGQRRFGQRLGNFSPPPCRTRAAASSWAK